MIKKLEKSGWTIQDVKRLNPTVSLGVAVREFPTDTGPVDYALFVNGIPVGVIEAKKSDVGENITTVEEQSARYANSTFKWVYRSAITICGQGELQFYAVDTQTKRRCCAFYRRTNGMAAPH